MPKRAFYATGSPYEIGYVRGFLDYNHTEIMTSYFLLHAVPSLIDKNLDLELTRNNETRGAWDIVCSLIEDIVVSGSVKSFKHDVQSGSIPSDVQNEMQGIVDGAIAGGANASVVTLEKIITINVGLDFASALVYSGRILDILEDRAASWIQSQPQEQRDAAATMLHAVLARLRGAGPAAWRSPALCDAFAAWGAATAGGSGSYFARDFQLSMGQVLQDLLAPTIFVPAASQGASGAPIPLVAATGPAFVGVFTALNARGFAMGVDTLRTCQGDPKAVGLNSVLLVRLAGHASPDSETATQFVASARRGASYLYPMSDANGDARILEAGTWRPSSAGVQDWGHNETCVQDASLRAQLPSLQAMQGWVEASERAGTWDQGVFIRSSKFAGEFPSEQVLPYSERLFQAAGLQLNSSAWLARRGQLMGGSWQQENGPAGKKLAAKFFSNPRVGLGSSGAPPNHLVVSNTALFPQMRVSQMGVWASSIPGEAIQWRYDSLSWLVDRQANGGLGGVDLPAAMRLIEFLKPCHMENATLAIDGLPNGVRVDSVSGDLCTPEYWVFDRLHESDPLSAPIQGSLAVCDLKDRRMVTKTGYFRDAWIQLTLPNYL